MGSVRVDIDARGKNKLLKSLPLSPPTAGAQMVRAAGQGHGRNDAATTDPQPSARCLSYAHDAMSVTRDSGSSSTRMFSSLLGSRTPHAGVFSMRIFSLLRGLWMFVCWGLDPKLSHLRPVFRRSEKSPGRGLAKGWESAE